MQKCNARISGDNDLSAKSTFIYISAKMGPSCSEFMFFVAPKLPMPWPWMVLPDNFYATLFVRHTECFRPFFLKYTTYFSETPKLYFQFVLKIALPFVFLIIIIGILQQQQRSIKNKRNFDKIKCLMV